MTARYPRLLQDSPATLDELNSHEAIAEAMFKLLMQEPGGKTIGLEGAWGSGKSTVIGMLEEKLRQPKKLYPLFFKFDVWVHKGDPLRRGFLEALIDDASKEWLSIGDVGGEVLRKWGELRSRLARKHRSIEKVSTPQIGWFEKALLFSVFLFPIATSLLIAGLTGKNNSRFSDYFNYFAYCALAAPPGLLFVALGLACKDLGRRNRIWGLFFSKSVFQEKQDTIEIGDQTSIEFQEDFRAMMTMALSARNKRLIIILDNLDRITTNEAEEVWSILRSFIDNPYFKGQEWHERLWVVIPYSKAGLAKGNEGAYEHFLDKVFQIRFTVPQPILTNLNAFLEKQLVLAFGKDNLSAEVLHDVNYIFAKELGATATPMPRDIITVVNNMVGTFLMWPAIPLGHHACFAIYKKKLPTQDIISLIIEGRFRGNGISAVLGSNLELSMVGLCCNVSTTVANQTLFWPLVERALSGHPDEASLSDMFDRLGFGEILDITLGDVLERNASQDGIRFLDNIRVINDSHILARISVERRQHYLKQIANAVRVLSHWPLWLKYTGETLICLVGLDESKVLLEQLKRSIVRSRDYLLQNDSNIFVGDDGAGASIANFHTLSTSRELHDYFGENVLAGTMLICSDPGKWIDLCRLAYVTERVAALRSFSPKTERHYVWQQMKAESYDHLARVGTIRAAINNEWSVPSDAYGGLSLILCRKPKDAASEANSIFPLLIEREAIDAGASQALKEFSFNPWIYHYFYIFASEDKSSNAPMDTEIALSNGATIDVAVFLFALLMRNFPRKPGRLNEGNINQGALLFDAMLIDPEKFPLFLSCVKRGINDIPGLETNIRNLVRNGSYSQYRTLRYICDILD